MTSTRGVARTDSILDKIVEDRRPVVARQKQDEPESWLRQRFAELPERFGMKTSITSPRGNAPADAPVQIVAEIKKASPSRGALTETLDVEAIARAYALGGAAGISVLTEPNYFLGSLEHLLAVRRCLDREFPGARPSLLRKDFLIEPYELVQARAYGADNILLIVAMLEQPLLVDLLQGARNLELDALVEVHTPEEAERAVAAGATLYGINNRDLHTFNVDLAVTERIRPLLPPDAVVIGESGVHKREDVERLHRAGVRAILVGEAFMTAPDVASKIAELRL
jgi:indole-3-glycerol phosphate synthase